LAHCKFVYFLDAPLVINQARQRDEVDWLQGCERYEFVNWNSVQFSSGNVL